MAGHLILQERELLYRLLKKGKSKTEIAEVMGRDRSTIYRELSRNTRRGGYEPELAQRLADRRRRACRRPRGAARATVARPPQRLSRAPCRPPPSSSRPATPPPPFPFIFPLLLLCSVKKGKPVSGT